MTEFSENELERADIFLCAMANEFYPGKDSFARHEVVLLLADYGRQQAQRAEFVKAALQGLAAWRTGKPEWAAELAVQYADATIKELQK